MGLKRYFFSLPNFHRTPAFFEPTYHLVLQPNSTLSYSKIMGVSNQQVIRFPNLCLQASTIQFGFSNKRFLWVGYLYYWAASSRSLTRIINLFFLAQVELPLFLKHLNSKFKIHHQPQEFKNCWEMMSNVY